MITGEFQSILDTYLKYDDLDFEAAAGAIAGLILVKHGSRSIYLHCDPGIKESSESGISELSRTAGLQYEVNKGQFVCFDEMVTGRDTVRMAFEDPYLAGKLLGYFTPCGHERGVGVGTYGAVEYILTGPLLDLVRARIGERCPFLKARPWYVRNQISGEILYKACDMEAVMTKLRLFQNILGKESVAMRYMRS